MASKRSRSVASSSMNTTTVISDLWTSHTTLAPNEYSSSTIGIHSCLVRYSEYESVGKYFYQGSVIDLRPQDFINRLNGAEKKLHDDCRLDIERYAMCARLQFYLRNNRDPFEDILQDIKRHLHECMREDLAASDPRSYEELFMQCEQRNQATKNLDQIYRMRRFQFYDDEEVNRLVNLISLQSWTQSHFESLVNNITADHVYRDKLLTNLKDLFNNAVFIVQHPSLPIATVNPVKGEGVTAKVNCRLFSLLDKSNSKMTVENIRPVVCRLSKSNPDEEANVSYPQSLMEWKPYSILTTSQNRKNFSGADLSEIVLNELFVMPQKQRPSTTKPRYSPYIYRIDFHINITVHFPNDPSVFQHCVIVQSSPFGLVTNTSQSADLFAEVFLEDLKRLKSIAPSRTPTLTLDDISDSVRRYFIHKTGVFPKPWVMPYIRRELNIFYNNDQSTINAKFQNILAKILAQIDYMAEHSLLSLFHDDGLFLGIYGSQFMDQLLLAGSNQCQTSVCVMRFRSIHNYSHAKDIAVRIDLASRSSITVQHFAFDANKLSIDLGTFITRIVFREAPLFENLLFSITEQDNRLSSGTWSNIYHLIIPYHSEKLRTLCPHTNAYVPIGITYSRENQNPQGANQPSTPAVPQNFGRTTHPRSNINDNLYLMHNLNINTTNQRQQASCSQIVQDSHHTRVENIQQSPITPSYPTQTNQQYIHSTPVVIIITSASQNSLSHQDVSQLISNNLPQYSSLIPSAHVHILNLSPPSQPIYFTSEQNSVNQANTMSPTKFSDFNHNQ